jgi:hypothetical protein
MMFAKPEFDEMLDIAPLDSWRQPQMGKKKKPYFAQTSSFDPKLHRAKHFLVIEEAIEWLLSMGGGTVKKRNAGVVREPGLQDIRVWGVVAEVVNDVTHLFTPPLSITPWMKSTSSRDYSAARTVNDPGLKAGACN